MVIWLFCLFLFAVVAVQWLMERRRMALLSPDQVPLNFKKVRGVTVSEQLAYHKHHIWLRMSGDHTAAIGIDDFAHRVIGNVDHVVLPLIGSRVIAGESCVKLVAGNREVALVAPISGEIVEVNEALTHEPDLVNQDSYGDGWLFRIGSWRLVDQEAQMIKGHAVVRWMEESVEKLLGGQMSSVGAVSQDGGTVAERLNECMDQHEWIQVVRHHLGTEPRLH